MGIPIRFLASKLVNKQLLRVSGQDALPYLQTFLTNDIRYVSPGSSRHCMYAHIINSMGRSLADVFVYQPTIALQDPSVQRNLVLAPFYSDDFGEGCLESDQVLIESSTKVTDGLQRTLFAMKIRKKVKIELVEDKQVWVIFPDQPTDMQRCPSFTKVSENALIVPDPRLPGLGHRLVVPSDYKFEDVWELFGKSFEVTKSAMRDYERYRFQLGIAEGVKDQPEGFVFPLECNADLLNGISFKKGLFSGDWITGRNFRKGVISRIVPFKLDSCDRDELDQVAFDSPLLHESSKQVIGVVRARRGKIGIASISGDYLSGSQDTQFVHGSGTIKGRCWIPNWWPKSIVRVNEMNIPDGKRNNTFIPENQR